MEKNEIRKMMFAKRIMLTDKKVEEASEAIIEIIKDQPFFNDSNLIMSYMAYGQEINLIPLNQYILDSGKRLCLPRVLNKTEMDAAEVVRLNEGIVKSKFGLMEPAPEIEPVDIESIDLILVPGLAFDREGNRIGHGKGYYDRFLGKIKKDTFTLGIAYSFQLFDHIPYDQYDKKVKGLVTENQLFLNL